MSHHNSKEEGQARKDANFSSTHWSIIFTAQGDSVSKAHAALESLCQRYWYPLYVFVRRQGYDHEEARDLTQSFFLHLLSHDLVRKVRPENGRFRCFLLKSLKHFLIGEWHKKQAVKRNKGKIPVSLDHQEAEERYKLEPTDLKDPAKLYERRWAMELLDHVMSQLEAEQVKKGQKEFFRFVQGMIIGGADQRTDDLAAQFKMTPEYLRVKVSRLRERYRELLRHEILLTVSSPEEVDDELKHLFAVLSS